MEKLERGLQRWEYNSSLGLMAIFLLILLWVAAPGLSVSLEQVQRGALEKNLNIRVQRLERDKSALERKKSFSELLPQVNAELSLNFTKEQSILFPLLPNTPPRELIFSREVYPKYVLVLSQEIYNPVKLSRYRIAKIRERAQEFMLREKERELVSRVRDAYFSALQLKALLDVYNKQRESVEAHLRDVKELYAQGVVALKDILETKVKLHQIKEKIASTEADYRKALELLSYLSGLKVRDVEDVGQEDIYDLSDRSPEELLKLAKRNRAVFGALRESLRASQEGVRLVRSAFLPSLSLRGVIQHSRESNVFPNDIYVISLSLRWNLFSGKGRFHALEISKRDERIQTLLKEDTERRLELSIEGILEDIKAARQRLELSRVRLKEAKEHLRIAKEKYRAGLGTNTEVIDAQSYLTSALKSLEVNRYQLLRLKLKLLEEVGYEE